MKLKSKLLYTLLAAIAVSVLPMKIQAQTGRSFTISSGQVNWLLGGQSGSLRMMSYRPDGSPDYGTYTGSDVTFQVDGGANYLALNPAGDGSLTVTNSFSDRCVWHNSDNPGYCYQEVEGYRYYLRGTVDGLSVWKVAVGQPIGTATKWTALEAGGYLDQSFVRNGQSVVARYWMMFDGSLPKMSCEALHRPESRRFVAQTGNAYTYYCPNGSGTGSTGVASVLLPVETIEHAASVPDAASQNIGVADISGTQTLKLGESFSPAVVYTPEAQAGANYNLIEAYREVRVCTKLKGLTLAGIGNEYVHGDHGIPTWTSYYYYSSDGYATRRTSTPTPVSTFISSASVNQWHWELDNASKRYLTISGENTASPTITCIATPAPNDVTATLTVTVTTTQGITESATVTFTVSSDFDRQTLTESENSVFINGAVFGGGRMADIDGSTDVLVINCDSVSRVYGGNDICGTVRDSAQVVIGNTATSDFLGINSVYGAGNGFYSYDGTSAPFTVCNTAIGVGTQVRNWGDNSGDIIATVDVPTNVPLIYKTKVFINSAYARIDTVFGGARNADVVLRPGIAANIVDTLASVTVNNGIVYAVFGGNNVGGCMNNDTLNHARSAVNINKTVLNPNLATDTAVVNSFYTRFGREYALRYVFGGGNKVFSALRSDVYVNGGMIDTCFAGGNMASVYRANVYVDCNDTNKIYHNGWVTDHDWDTEADMVDKWVGTRGNYNIRALFGGNNRAPMECVPDVLLTAGGIGVVYGGGSAGDMVNERLNIASDVTYVERHRNAITNAKNEFNEAKNRLVAPQAALGTFIHVPATSTDLWVDYLYGGCRSANVNHATLVHLEGGHIGTVFGGCNISGNVGWAKVQSATGRGRGGTYVVIDEGAKVYVDVFGGSNGYYHCVDNEQAAAAKYIADPQFTDNQGTPFDPFNDYVGFLRPTHNYTHLLMNGGEVYGNVYGGGNHATVGYFNSTYGYPDANAAGGFASGEASPKHGSVHLSLMKGTIHGNVFGGSNMSTVYGLSYFYIGNKADGEYVTVLGDVYGGNDRLGDVGNGVTLPFADASGTELTASDGTPLNDGGVANYNTYIYVQGTPHINRLFGGGNGAYNYGEQPEYGEPLEAFCTSTANHTTVPVLASAFIDINTDPTARIDTVFGGGNAADVQDHVMVLLNTTHHDVSDETVGIIFGGNNQASMNCVPEVKVQKGVVNTIFGGGNMGHMLATTDAILDQCGNTVPSVSSYVLLNSDEATVLGAVFGGCNKADVHGMAYVQVVNTSDRGVDTIYGGNDVSGRITGDTRVDIFGGNVGTIYGGSNGYYDYEEHGINGYRVRTFNHAQNTGEILYENSIGSPYVDETTVNIFGGYVKNNIYGGGRMGDCRLTNVIINDDVCPGTAGGGAILRGRVYGGGEGDTARLDIAHRGNVREATNVELHHASDIIAIAYGGGKGGDVHNANLTSFDTWDESFQRIFGGCWGSDVTGTARTTIDANMTILAGDNSIYTAEQIFGGNDFTGNCFRSELILNSGRFDTVYGAGCGKYPATPYLTSTGTYTQNRDLYVPNNEEVVVTVNGSDPLDPSETTVWVNGILFGGGQMGTTMRYVKNSMGHYIDASNNEITSAAQAKVADTNLTVANAHTNANDYAYISVNVHGGQFAKDIFAGAQGEEGHSQLVYGLKMLNMDGGYVKQSIYGGSQSVSDGYPAECAEGTSADPVANTTLRPSSILNIAGGIVKASVYGAGYQGNTYGSVYVNVGSKAIENSKVWERDIAGSVDSYTNFKPGETDGVSPALTPGHVILDASVYGGANWGSNDGSFDFRVPGFYGGESRIYVDGEGYNTQGSSTSTLPTMDIANSIIGSGTSVQGGDVHNSIHVYNYGAVDYSSCHASKTLRSIQRADELYLWNTAIFYSGATDAASAYPSQQLTIMRVDTVKVRGYNVIDLNAVMTEVAQLHFYEDALDGDGNLVHTTNQDLIVSDSNQCRNDMQVCDRLRVIDPETNKYAAMVVNNGVNVDILTTEGGYGFVEGFGYLFAETGTNAVVTARAKYIDEHGVEQNFQDGGFMASCADSNLVISERNGTSIRWDSCAHAHIDCSLAEYPYNNFRTSYRVWSVGQGKRTRFAVLLAHAQPELLPQDDKKVKLYDDTTRTNYDLALAHAELVLPPTTPGHYYRLGTDGVTIEDDNAVLRFVDKTWHPVSWSGVGTDPNVAQTNPAQGTWEQPALADGSSRSDLRGVKLIQDNPATTFGLVMTSGKNFDTTGTNTYREPETYSGTWNQGGTAISGNNHVNIIQNFYSAQVGADVNALPVMDLYLTYSTNFSSTMLGTVYFTLDEYKAVPKRANYNGSDISTNTGAVIPDEYIDSNLNQPINVAITIATLLEKFKDMEYDLLAMYNEGRSNTFIRKAVLPATLHSRELYLDSISWWPEDCGATDFLLTGDSASVISATDPNVFRVGVQPMDNISSTLTSTVGWHTINQDTVADIFSTAMPYTGASKTEKMKFSKESGSSATCASYDNIGLTGQGLHIGELDGRGLAALNLSLTYDGNKVYPDTVVGHLDLHFTAYNPVDTSKFKIRVNVKCRTVGDTIYLASADHVDRCGKHLTPGSLADVDPGNTQKIGKRPSKYLQNFMQAFDASIYEEGDVIAIIDTMKITDAVSIRGVDYFAVPVIRYTGHHSDLPGECGVFRGTMLDVSTSDGMLSATCVDFGGGSVGRIIDESGTQYPEYWNATLNTPDPYKRLDTNQVYGPIIAVHDGGTVTLSNGTSLHSNYNGYTDTDIKRRGSAVSVTKGGNLVFVNSVDIENNFVPAQVGDHPTNGAIYVDSGTVTLNPSHKATAVNITKNYIYSGSTPYWTNYKDAAGHVVRFMVDTNYTKTADKRNVFLTRTPDASDAVMKDEQSDMIDMVSVLPDNTLIGVSKWFPGEDVRDTIRFAFGHKFTDLLQATHVNNNFVSDEGYNIFYEYNVDNSRIFLHRCATFHHQVDSVPLPYNNGGTLHAGDVLSYVPLVSATCPTGGDEIIYRVQGGFFPYTYTWSGSSDKTRTTAVVNNTLISQVEGGNYTNYIDAIADTLLTPHVSMTPHEFSDTLKYHVEAKDVSGFCTLKKDIKVTLKKTDVDNPDRFVPILDGSADGWTDPDTAVRALGTRNYKAIKITPKVWVNRNAGTIDARVVGDDNDYVYQEVVNVDPLTGDETVIGHELDSLLFCEGDIIRLTTTPKSESTKFIMWDFDPYYSQTASYVVPSRNSDVVAYYGPNNYWKDQVNSEVAAHAVHDANYDYTTRDNAGDAAAGYVTTYDGDVHIYNENGLAWLISVVNGYNGQQVRPFYFNKVFIHQKDNDEPYDMQNYLWSPMGTQQYGFRGRFIGVGKPSVVTDSSTTPLVGDQVVIRNIIVNEPSMYHVGFFGNLDTAQISGIKLEAVFARGGHYVGGLAANSVYSKIDNCAVSDSAENDATASILTTHYVSGGLIGRSSHDVITNSKTAAKYVGDAVYSGGMVGHGTATSVTNSGALNISRMSGLYIGGIAGYLDGEAPRTRMLLFHSNGSSSVLANNYVHLLAEAKHQQRVGGIVGYAENTILENNYAYGKMRNAGVHGGVAGALSNNTSANHNYYAASDAAQTVGVAAASANLSDNASFRGKGNAVTISQPVYGVNNLTRVLNRWVRQQNADGGQYKTWRSDLEEVHDGYPLFGQPDLIPVNDTVLVEGCEQVEWQGVVYTEDDQYAVSFIDSVEMVDSTLVTLIRLHYGTNTNLTDSAIIGEEYSGYGFVVSAAESALLRRTLDSTGRATLVLTDTLQTAFGCDSVVTLTLTFHSESNEDIDIVDISSVSEVKVYPNPTVNIIHVEAEQMSHVEIYDNEGRVLQNRDTYDASSVTLDLSYYPSGIYYVRIHTPNNVTIQKVVKR